MANNNNPLRSRDLAAITGFDERYINYRMDKANIDLTSVRRLDDGRIVAKTRGGQNRILYGIDSGERGRRIYWGSWGSVSNLIINQSDYPEIESYGAQIFYPRLTIEE
jgi:hypothetical protein